MQTTAGSLALVGMKPPRDAALVAWLREAGAVILGKTNLSEWANMRSTRSTSGWSARGGLTRNPYALDRNTSGSSSGSGASMAASLAALAVGTETDGSITSPASVLLLGGDQAHGWAGQPRRHHSHCPFARHRGPNGAQRGRRRGAADRHGR